MIDVDRLTAETFLQHACWLDETGSTNSVAMELALQPALLPAIVGAEAQTQGRGRNHHRWWGGPGALMFSILLEPESFAIPRSRWPLLSLTTGLSVCLALEALLPGAPIQLKWPNDVYVAQRKICGILHETIPARPQNLIIGIGINVNNSLAAAPAELQQTATSMIDIEQQPFDRTEILITLLNIFEKQLQSLSEDTSSLIASCRERCFLTGKLLTLRDVHADYTGMCQGIDDDGALRLMTEVGPLRFYSGQILRID